MDLLMVDFMTDQKQRGAAESAAAERLVQWRGEDAIELVKELNSIAARTYFAKWRSENG
jgi:hypothetical protein